MKRLFVIAGPSGVGKSHLIEALVMRYPEEFTAPKLCTTRPQRPGEHAIDREFVSREVFKARQAAGEFVLVEDFGGSLYGYALQAYQPTDKHHLVNLTPDVVSQMKLKVPRVLIGMTVEPDELELLWERMAQRGDSAEVRAERMKTIYTDMAGLEAYRELFEREGQIFDIHDDRSFEVIIEWVKENYLNEEV